MDPHRPESADSLTGSQIQLLREEIGWSRVALGKRLGMSEGWIRRVESDAVTGERVNALAVWLQTIADCIRANPPPQIT